MNEQQYIGWMTWVFLQEETLESLQAKKAQDDRHYASTKGQMNADYTFSLHEALSVFVEDTTIAFPPRVLIDTQRTYAIMLERIANNPRQWQTLHLKSEVARGWYEQQIRSIRQRLSKLVAHEEKTA